MKNKKLFGKLNVVDIVIIVVLIAAVVLVGIKYLGKSSDSEQSGRSISYDVVCPVVPAVVYQGLKDVVPGKMMSNGNVLDATVESVEVLPCDVESIEFKSSINTLLTYTIPVTQDYVKLVFHCTARVSDSIKSNVGTQEVRVGKEHIVKTTDFEVSGYISSVKDNG